MHYHENKQKNYRLRLDLIVSLVIIGVLLGLFLNRVEKIQQNIEQQNIKTQVDHFRLGIAEKWINLKIANKPFDIDAIKNTNPMNFIHEQPENYIGELAQSPQDSNSIWYFNTSTHRLVYVTRNGEEWHYALAKAKQKRTLTNIGLDLIKLETTQ